MPHLKPESPETAITPNSETTTTTRKRKADESSQQPSEEHPSNLKILPRSEWLTDGNYRLLCKISGCVTRGRSDRDDMCKRHYGMFRKAGVCTGGRQKKRKVVKKNK